MNKDENGTNRFEIFNNDLNKISDLIFTNLWVLANTLEYEIIFYVFPFDDIVYKAKDIIRQNLDIVHLIAN